jgi:hypothetical protein
MQARRLQGTLYGGASTHMAGNSKNDTSSGYLSLAGYRSDRQETGSIFVRAISTLNAPRSPVGPSALLCSQHTTVQLQSILLNSRSMH